MRKAAVIFTIVALLALALGATAAAAKRSADGPQVEGFKGPGPQKGHAAPSSNRLMVMTDGEVTAEMLVALGNHSRVLGVVHRYNVVVVNPSKRGGRGAIEGLSFVTHSEPDGSRYLSDAGTWDRDIIDVVDVEETGLVGDPDRREVEQNGRGVHVAVIDTGLVMNWRDFISEDKVDTELSRRMGKTSFARPLHATCGSATRTVTASQSCPMFWGSPRGTSRWTGRRPVQPLFR